MGRPRRKVNDCLRFFGVASPDDWRKHYGDMQLTFRRSRVEQSDIGAISAWLRLGEQEAEMLDGPNYHKARCVAALKTIRNLTREPPEAFEPQMRQLLHEAGVLLVLVPAIPCAHVSGVARWLSPTRPLIQLSLYGKSNDKFWFTFFHEAAHILLHANTQQDKKSVFLDDPRPTAPAVTSRVASANTAPGAWCWRPGVSWRMGISILAGTGRLNMHYNLPAG